MKRFLKTTIAAGLLAAPLHASPYADPYTSLFVLGDSNSDEGQTTPQEEWLDLTQGAPYHDVEGDSFLATLPRPELALEPGEPAPPPPPPPEFDTEAGGTYTNGLPWSRILGEAFAFDGKPYVNLASYGAMAASSSSAPGNFSAFDQSVIALDVAEILGPQIGLRPLVSLWFGMEDMIEVLDDIALDEFRDAEPSFAPSSGVDGPRLRPGYEEASLAAEAIADSVYLLASDFGSVFRDFLILDLPVMALMPRYAEIPRFMDQAFDLTEFFNEELRDALNETLTRLEEGDGIRNVNITILDVTEITFEAAIGLGYDDIGPCITEDGAYPALPELEVAAPAFEPGPGERSRPTCTDPTEFLFLDDVHMEAGAHDFLGRAAAASVGVTPVPLPAGAWLLLGGLGALALRRKRAA